MGELIDDYSTKSSRKSRGKQNNFKGVPNNIQAWCPFIKKAFQVKFSFHGIAVSLEPDYGA